jgi:hypothetical protein
MICHSRYDKDHRYEAHMMTLANLIHTRRLIGLGALLSATILFAMPHAGLPQNLSTKEEIARTLAVEKVAVADDGGVSGEVSNRSRNTIRDVQLFIRHTWLWHNEMKPGKDDPGRSTYYTLPAEIPPGARVPFTFKPSAPLPKTSGGHFETTVSVAGFTEVIPETR